MYERFTDRARRVVDLAQEEARLLDHTYIGTEHILLGLIHEGESVAAKALEALGVPLEAVHFQVEEIIGRGGSAPPGHIPFTPRVKKVFELSWREAEQLGLTYVAPEHILLGLEREGEGVAAQVLTKLGIDLPLVRTRVLEIRTKAQQIPGDSVSVQVLGGLPDESSNSRYNAALQLLLREAEELAGEDHQVSIEHLLQAMGRRM